MLRGARILLGVTGGIAAYKSCELARMLIREGAEVQVVLTSRAAEFVTPLTFTALTGHPALVDEFPAPGLTPTGDVYAHLNLTRDIDCFLIAPASANTSAKLAQGLADNLVSAAYLSCTAPVVIAPAMNNRMWEHQATQANMAVLRERGHLIVEPGVGELACGDTGAGRLADLRDIFSAVAQAALGSPRPLAGKRVVVTAGGTREYLDPVRFITNASSGRLGLEVCRALAARGAEVTLVDTGIDVAAEMARWLAGRREVRTAFDLLKELDGLMPESDALVMLAAVADYAPANYEAHKHKKDGSAWNIALGETPDVLAAVARARRPGQALIGVSLEDTDWLKRGMKKAAAKGVQLMLAVELGADLPFGAGRLNCALVTERARIAEPALRDKATVANILADWLAGWFSQPAAGSDGI